MTVERITPALPSRRGEKLEQRLRRPFRRLLGEIMPAVEGKAPHVGRPFTPGRERAIGLGRDAAGGAQIASNGQVIFLPDARVSSSWARSVVRPAR